jgi:hypothetical protein
MQFYAEGGTITKRHPVTSRFAEGASEDFDKITVDDVIRIDHSSHVGNEDKAHLLLKGDLPVGDHYVRVKNSGGTLMNINHAGKIHAFAGLSSPEITNLTTVLTANVTNTSTNTTGLANLNSSIATVGTDIAALEIVVNNAAPATSTAVENSIVKRDNVNGTVFTKLDTDILSAETAVNLVKDGQLLFTPHTMVNGVSVPKPGVNGVDWQFRFGRAEETADTSDNTQDGLEFISPSRNEILIQVNEGNPTITTVNDKLHDVWVRHRDSQRTSQYEVNQFGNHTRIHVISNISMTPGILLSQNPAFGEGVTDFVFTLATPWIFANVPEHEVILERHLSNPYNVFTFLFMSNPGVNIQSRVYLKRETHMIDNLSVASELRYIIAVEPRGAETQFPTGTKMVLRVKIDHFIIGNP